MDIQDKFTEHVTLTWEWAQKRLKSPASRLFTQPFIQTQIKENIKAPHHWPLCGEFIGDRWIPRTNGQWRGKWFHLVTSSWKDVIFCHIIIHLLPKTCVTFAFPDTVQILQLYDDLTYWSCFVSGDMHLFALPYCTKITAHPFTLILDLSIMMTSSNGNFFRVTGPFCGEFTGHLWISHTKDSDA